MTSSRPSLLIALFAFGVAACQSDPPESDPTTATAYRIEGTCEQYTLVCDEEFAECTARGEQACNTCLQIGGFGCASYCDYRPDCLRWHCHQSSDCLAWSHTTTLGDQDPAIREACEMASAHQVACGQQPSAAGNCELFAATERAHAAAVYECIATAPCGEEAGCDDMEPDEDLSRRVCDAMADCDREGTSCGDGSFAAWLGWLRDDVKRAVLQCAELADCEERYSCVEAWAASLDPLT